MPSFGVEVAALNPHARLVHACHADRQSLRTNTPLPHPQPEVFALLQLSDPFVVVTVAPIPAMTWRHQNTLA